MHERMYRIGEVLPEMGFTREEGEAWRKEESEWEQRRWQQMLAAGWRDGLRVRIKSGEYVGELGRIVYFRGPVAAWVRFDDGLGSTFGLDELEQMPE